jgi:hypothetical protein
MYKTSSLGGVKCLKSINIFKFLKLGLMFPVLLAGIRDEKTRAQNYKK